MRVRTKKTNLCFSHLLNLFKGMSVYEQIASKARNRRQRKPVNDDDKLNEQTEDDEDDRTSNINSIHQRINLQSSTTTLESSTSSLLAHHRHLHRRRKRSKLIQTINLDEPKQVLNKTLERQRLRPTKRSN